MIEELDINVRKFVERIIGLIKYDSNFVRTIYKTGFNNEQIFNDIVNIVGDINNFYEKYKNIDVTSISDKLKKQIELNKNIMKENIKLDDLKKLIRENSDVFKQKVKNKLKKDNKMSDSDASKLIKSREKDLDDSYNNKENENKATVKLMQKKDDGIVEQKNKKISITELRKLAKIMKKG